MGRRKWSRRYYSMGGGCCPKVQSDSINPDFVYEDDMLADAVPSVSLFVCFICQLHHIHVYSFILISIVVQKSTFSLCKI